jgi:hypothetical protein
MRWVGHVACVGEKKNACSVVTEKQNNLRNLGIQKKDMRMWSGFI